MTVLCPECIILHFDACVPGFSLEPLDGKFSGHTDFVLFMFVSPVLNRLSHGRCASVYCKIGVAQGIDREAKCPRGRLNTPEYTWPPTSEGSTCDFLSLRWCGNDTYSVENVLGILIFSWPSSTVISPDSAVDQLSGDYLIARVSSRHTSHHWAPPQAILFLTLCTVCTQLHRYSMLYYQKGFVLEMRLADCRLMGVS